jgi:predicted nucleic acid-binding protein
MRVFVDTTALFAVLDAADQNHARASAAWQALVADGSALVCTSYVLVETFALLQSRLGLAAVRAFQDDVVPLLQVEWIDAERHQRSVAALLVAGRRQLSLVDCASFDTMRSAGLTQAFTFDRHFAEQGFDCVPAAEP